MFTLATAQRSKNINEIKNYVLYCMNKLMSNKHQSPKQIRGDSEKGTLKLCNYVCTIYKTLRFLLYFSSVSSM